MSSLRLPGRIGVVDVETTGLFPMHGDRVLEVAVVVLGADGRVEREFVTLVNPARDVGPTRIHGITASDIAQAPSFPEIAAHVIDAAGDVVAVAGHNVRFDRQFVESEFARFGCELPTLPTLCTMRLAGGGKLGACCRDFGVPPPETQHSALSDARATAGLLAALLADAEPVVRKMEGLAPISWPRVARTSRLPITRAASRARQAEPPSFLERIAESAGERTCGTDLGDAAMEYLAVLQRALEDRRIDAGESEALVRTALDWGLTDRQVTQAHSEFLAALADAAVADSVVTEPEMRDLGLVATLLGLRHLDLHVVLLNAFHRRKLEASPAARVFAPAENLAGKRVCFTGEFACRLAGKQIDRELATRLAERAGLVVAEYVTKRLDLLVVGDPMTQSGKAVRARTYGIRVLHEPVFWKALGVKVD